MVSDIGITIRENTVMITFHSFQDRYRCEENSPKQIWGRKSGPTKKRGRFIQSLNTL